MARRVLTSEGAKPESEVSITFMDNESVRLLNREYRGIDDATDVLSFSLEEQVPGEPPIVDGPEVDVLGDVVVSLERAREQAESYGHSFEREVGFLVAHGVLHLLGYDHDDPEGEETMRAKTEDVLSTLNLTRPRW